MPKVHIPLAAQGFFDTVYNLSSTFRDVVDKALIGGDISYVFTDANVSFYDHEKRIISIGLKTGDGSKARMDSDIIFEMCNAYHEQSGYRPPMKDFDDALKFAEATEKSEWLSVQKHFTIVSELEKHDSGWDALNRFKPGFLRKNKSWFEFDNYLEEQKNSGHTDMIAKHHPNYGK